MKSYFFVPATKLHKLSKVLTIGVDEIIIDLEDSVSFTNTPKVIEDMLKMPELAKYFVRVPLIDIYTNQIDVSIIKKIKSAGFYKFMLPKLQSFDQFITLTSALKFEPRSIILLVENPGMLQDAPMILKEFPDIFHGITLGSHDYISETGGLYTMTNLEYPRQMILNYARIADISAIDIASMEIDDMENFRDEIFDGFHKGYDGKLLIHPKQLNFFDQIQFYSTHEYDWANKVLSELGAVNGLENFSPVVINGTVVERPHLNRAKKIMNWFEKK